MPQDRDVSQLLPLFLEAQLEPVRTGSPAEPIQGVSAHLEVTPVQKSVANGTGCNFVIHCRRAPFASKDQMMRHETQLSSTTWVRASRAVPEEDPPPEARRVGAVLEDWHCCLVSSRGFASASAPIPLLPWVYAHFFCVSLHPLHHFAGDLDRPVASPDVAFPAVRADAVKDRVDRLLPLRAALGGPFRPLGGRRGGSCVGLEHSLRKEK